MTQKPPSKAHIDRLIDKYGQEPAMGYDAIREIIRVNEIHCLHIRKISKKLEQRKRGARAYREQITQLKARILDLTEEVASLRSELGKND